MAKLNGSALMFDADEVRRTTAFLPRLLRVIFYRLQITNETYAERYIRTYRELFRQSRKECSQKLGTDRKFAMERKKLTFNLLSKLILYMGYDIEEVSIRIRDRMTGEELTFSTSETVEEMNEVIQHQKPTGLTSL